MKTPFGLLILITTFFLSFSTHAQRQNTDYEAVLYDPSFWKKELKLKPKQLQKINNINHTFYKSLSEIDLKGRESGKNQVGVSDLVEDRNYHFWNVFTERQKFKWRRISRTFFTKNS